MKPKIKNNIHQQGENASRINGDCLELRRVVSNLIGNAIKFTDEGGVEVRLSDINDDIGQSWIKLEVEDTGYGISEEDQKTVFERFRQGKNKRSGSGLGLHLSQMIVKTHGGEIKLTSELGKGSLFTVLLPRE